MSNMHETGAAGQDQSASNHNTTDRTREQEVQPIRPPVALRCDGRLLLGVEAFATRDLGGREIWVGVALSKEEEAFVLGRCENAAQEAASQLVGKLPKKKERKKE